MKPGKTGCSVRLEGWLGIRPHLPAVQAAIHRMSGGGPAPAAAVAAAAAPRPAAKEAQQQQQQPSVAPAPAAAAAPAAMVPQQGKPWHAELGNLRRVTVDRFKARAPWISLASSQAAPPVHPPTTGSWQTALFLVSFSIAWPCHLSHAGLRACPPLC